MSHGKTEADLREAREIGRSETLSHPHHHTHGPGYGRDLEIRNAAGKTFTKFPASGFNNNRKGDSGK